MFVVITFVLVSLVAIESLPVGYQHDTTETLSTKQVMVSDIN